MGIGCYIYAVNFTQHGFIGVGYNGPGVLILLIIFKIILQTRESYCVPKEDQIIIWTTKEGKFHWDHLKSLLLISLTNILLFVGFNFAWGFAKKGELNQGIISSLMALTSVINCFTFYCFFK